MITKPNARDLLTQLGIGNYNSTMMIQDMFVAPATSDPASPQIMLIVHKIQQNLAALGAPVMPSGRLDQPTADALAQVAGDGWLSKSWAQVIANVLDARAANISLAPDVRMPEMPEQPMAGILDAPFGLPAVPGGLITYVVGGLVAWRLLSKKKRTA